MQTWLNFWNLFFWLCFSSFIFNSGSLIKLLLLSEICWLVLYNYSILVGCTNDDVTVLTCSFYILGFAGTEFSLGILLLLLLKRFSSGESASSTFEDKSTK